MHGEGSGTPQGQEARIDAIWREHRPFLVDLAFRMLGNIGDAEDTVQDAFARLLRVDLDGIEDVRGWLVVVVSRLCIDDLRSARSRREVGRENLDVVADAAFARRGPDPADRVTLDEGIRMALLVVLQQLSPPERVVFVLHDVFGFSFEAVASIVGRSPAACRKLASRARRRVEAETGPDRFAVEPVDQERVAERFIAACAGGDLGALMQLLDPDVVGDVDLGADAVPRSPLIGARTVARNLLVYLGGGTGATLVSQPINGRLGALAFRNRDLVAMLVLETRSGLIVDIHAVVDPRKLALVTSELESVY